MGHPRKIKKLLTYLLTYLLSWAEHLSSITKQFQNIYVPTITISKKDRASREVAVLMRTALYLRRFKPTAATSQVNFTVRT